MTFWAVRAADAVLWAEGKLSDADLALSWPTGGEPFAMFAVRVDGRRELKSLLKYLATHPGPVCWNQTAPALCKPGRGALENGTRRYASREAVQRALRGRSTATRRTVAA